MNIFRRTPDTTDYDKPFTLKIVEPSYTFTGKLRYNLLHIEQFSYPEQMYTAASILREEGWPVWTFGPDESEWKDDRAPREDISIDANGDDDALFDDWDEMPF